MKTVCSSWLCPGDCVPARFWWNTHTLHRSLAVPTQGNPPGLELTWLWTPTQSCASALLLDFTVTCLAVGGAEVAERLCGFAFDSVQIVSKTVEHFLPLTGSLSSTFVIGCPPWAPFPYILFPILTFPFVSLRSLIPLIHCNHPNLPCFCSFFFFFFGHSHVFLSGIQLLALSLIPTTEVIK